ncbi:unnamed protein product [Effrenium voratum]|nr:unnamed protein product [Effrenium voratum]
MQAMFPEKSVERMNALMRALHTTLQMLFDAGRSSNPDAAFVSDLFSASADGTQSPLIEEMRRQHLHEVLEFTAELSHALIRAAGGEIRVNIHGRMDAYMLISKEDTLRVLSERIPEIKSVTMVDAMWKIGEETTPYQVAEVLQKFRHNFLLKQENAWVVVGPKAVVEKALELGSGQNSVPEGDEEKETGQLSAKAPQPRRNRALKVLDNSFARDEAYTPQALQKEVRRSARKFTEEERLWLFGPMKAGRAGPAPIRLRPLRERRVLRFGWLRGFRTSYDKVPSMVETSVQTERTRSTVPIPRPRTIRLPGPEDAQEEGEIGYSSPDFRAQVAAAKLMGILWAKEPSQVRLDQSLYGAAFVLPQIARSAGWPKMLRVLVIKTWVVLFLNYAVQFAVLYMIAKENMVWDLFSGQMYLCDFGRDAESCPDGPNCIGPGGTVFTNTRYYGWGQWSTRTYARDAFKAMFPEFSPEISKYSDPGEYGVESSTCRVLCCALFIVTVLSDLLGSFNLAFIMNSVPSQDDLWIDWDPPGGDWASKEYAKKVTGSNEMDFVKLKIAGMPFHWKVLNWLLILFLAPQGMCRSWDLSRAV